MIFLDTSVIISASTPSDPRHGRCVKALELAEREGGVCATHSLAEVFSTLYSRPLPLRMPPLIAAQIVQHTSKRFRTLTISTAEYLATITEAATLGHSGGIVYDALLVACARKAKATAIYTLNTKHFRMFAPDLRSIIREP